MRKKTRDQGLWTPDKQAVEGGGLVAGPCPIRAEECDESCRGVSPASLIAVVFGGHCVAIEGRETMPRFDALGPSRGRRVAWRAGCLFGRLPSAGTVMVNGGHFPLAHGPRIEDFPGAGWLPDRFDLFVHFCMYGGWAAKRWWGAGRDRAQRVASRGGCLSVSGVWLFDEVSQACGGRGRS
jgi:hypothetical protein